MSSETATAHDVALIVSADTVIAAKVLQMVNSAFFRLGRPITNIEQAVNYLGFTAVRNLVMSAEVFAGWPKSPSRVLDPERLQLHAHTVATVAQAYAINTPFADDALLAALLHDIGYWVLMQECPGELESVVAMASTEGISLCDAERRVIGSTHAEIGAYLLGIWGLPNSIVEAVAYHHAPQSVPPAGFDVLAVLATACAFAPSDDAAAFTGSIPSDPQVGADYLQATAAPFDWNEAQRRAAECLAPGLSNT